ncbi:hypothetical protein [Clostridium sp.]|uniref:hypothetical protein n=1 Tax=Clostridium sp. TaxID=1506 RepID=UPI002610875B|nr:hypothetical protein [Clostridium sp.]
MTKQTKAINIRMSEELNKRVEDYCWNNRVRVSTWIRQVIEEKLNEIEVNGAIERI